MKKNTQPPARFTADLFADEAPALPTQSVPKDGDVPQSGEEWQLDALFRRLSQSDFRRRFHLKPADRAYIDRKGMDTIRQHAADFIRQRIAPAVIPNDGKQTPMRGHPVFLAQHATGCCCRGCFAKWHHIPAGRELTPEEQRYAVALLMEWIRRQRDSG